MEMRFWPGVSSRAMLSYPWRRGQVSRENSGRERRLWPVDKVKRNLQAGSEMVYVWGPPGTSTWLESWRADAGRRA